MTRRVFLPLLFTVAALLFPARAFADPPGPHTAPVAVIAFDSDDAEENADALTGALRSRVRNAPAWSLVETTQSLGMLTAALKCPTKPPPECQQRIGEHIKSDRYIWGLVSRGPSTGQVTAEVHLYQRNKPDLSIKESYADNLKDPQDDRGLARIAQRIVERLGGIAVGAIVVRTGDRTGEVIVDGEKRVPLKDGMARVEVAPGGHSVEIASTGLPTTRRNVVVQAGKETLVEHTASDLVTKEKEKDTPFPTRKVLGGVALGSGVIFGAVAVQQTIFYAVTLHDRQEQIAARVPSNQKPCESPDKEFCDTEKRAQLTSGIAIATGAAGAILIGTGIYLLFTNPDTEQSAATTKPRVVPTVGTNGSGFVVTGAF